MKAVKDGINIEEITILNRDKIPDGMIIMETDMEED